MGIALPKWIIEGKNNIWVLGVYGLVFGGALPALVVRPSSNSQFFEFLYKNVVRDAGGSVVVRRQKMESTRCRLQLSSSLLVRNHPWRKSWEP